MTNMNEEIIKYTKDPIEFLKENRIGVSSKTWRCESLGLMDYEERFLRHIHDNNFSITKKSRQMHMSTLTAAYCAWMMIFHFDKSIAIMCPTKDEANRFIEHVRIILQNYSNDFFHWEDNFVKNNKSEIRLDNGSYIKALSAKSSSLRGYNFDVVIMDEIAFMKQAPDIWNTLTPHLFNNSKIILYSSTNGLNFFYDLWAKAIRGEMNFSAISFDYEDNPDYDDEWYDTQVKRLGYDEDSIKAELLGSFVGNKTPESHRLNLRVKGSLYEKMINKTGSSNVSDYIRGLIKKDLGL
jgi:hypothetical protein